jgi:hypothetical protein
MFGTVIVLKFGHSLKWQFQSAWSRLTGKDPPPRPITYHNQIVDIEDPDEEEAPSGGE